MEQIREKLLRLASGDRVTEKTVVPSELSARFRLEAYRKFVAFFISRSADIECNTLRIESLKCLLEEIKAQYNTQDIFIDLITDLAKYVDEYEDIRYCDTMIKLHLLRPAKLKLTDDNLRSIVKVLVDLSVKLCKMGLDFECFKCVRKVADILARLEKMPPRSYVVYYYTILANYLLRSRCYRSYLNAVYQIHLIDRTYKLDIAQLEGISAVAEHFNDGQVNTLFRSPSNSTRIFKALQKGAPGMTSSKYTRVVLDTSLALDGFEEFKANMEQPIEGSWKYLSFLRLHHVLYDLVDGKVHLRLDLPHKTVNTRIYEVILHLKALKEGVAPEMPRRRPEEVVYKTVDVSEPIVVEPKSAPVTKMSVLKVAVAKLFDDLVQEYRCNNKYFMELSEDVEDAEHPVREAKRRQAYDCDKAIKAREEEVYARHKHTIIDLLAELDLKQAELKQQEEERYKEITRKRAEERATKEASSQEVPSGWARKKPQPAPTGVAPSQPPARSTFASPAARPAPVARSNVTEFKRMGAPRSSEIPSPRPRAVERGSSFGGPQAKSAEIRPEPLREPSSKLEGWGRKSKQEAPRQESRQATPPSTFSRVPASPSTPAPSTPRQPDRGVGSIDRKKERDPAFSFGTRRKREE